ncbi:MAG: rhomboid family intramembrane serine protease [Tannerella sp.]|jgi:membrane associated rhomboid family serine protease|nr:rhomboid family intramembrane serine protease [Tannerella sp.]
MNDIFNKIRQLFSRGDMSAKFIYVNVGVFLVIRLTMVILTLFRVKGVYFPGYLQMPSSPMLLLYRPWTVFTYMFLHVDFLHLLFNMLWLYWFGRIFLLFFNARQLGGVYISGGIAGAALFLAAYNLFPYFLHETGAGFLMGASASVMAIVFAVSFYQKNYEINLLLIGRIKLIYLAVATLLIDLLSITSTNAGGHIAHLGGALFGILFASRLRMGKDMTVSVNRWIDKIVNLKKRRKRNKHMKVAYKRPETDMEYNARKRDEMQTLDAILEKLKRSGYNSLSANEKKILFDAGKK